MELIRWTLSDGSLKLEITDGTLEFTGIDEVVYEGKSDTPEGIVKDLNDHLTNDAVMDDVRFAGLLTKAIREQSDYVETPQVVNQSRFDTILRNAATNF